MPKIDLAAIAAKRGSDYPHPLGLPLAGRESRAVGRAGGAVDFNANHVVLPPGCWSSQRHWHEGEDELVVVLSGTGTLIDESGATIMVAGDIAVFPKNDGNGHTIVNHADTNLVLLAVSPPERSTVTYSDVDLVWTPDGGQRHRDGTPYPTGG